MYIYVYKKIDWNDYLRESDLGEPKIQFAIP